MFSTNRRLVRASFLIRRLALTSHLTGVSTSYGSPRWTA